MDREQLRNALVDLADGALAPDAAKAMERALEEHPDLKREYRDLRQAVALAKALPPMELPAELNARIRRAVDEAAATRPGRTRSIWIWMSGVAAALVIAVVGVRLLDGPGADKSELTRRTATADAGPPAAAPVEEPVPSAAKKGLAAEGEKEAGTGGAFGGETRRKRKDVEELVDKEGRPAVHEPAKGALRRESESDDEAADTFAKKSDRAARPRPAPPSKSVNPEWSGENKRERARSTAPARGGVPSAKGDARPGAHYAEAETPRPRFKSTGRAGPGPPPNAPAVPRAAAAPGARSETARPPTAERAKKARGASAPGRQRQRPAAPEPLRVARDGTTGVLSVEVDGASVGDVKMRIVRFLLERAAPTRAVPASAVEAASKLGLREVALEVALADVELDALRRALGDAARVVPGQRSRRARELRRADAVAADDATPARYAAERESKARGAKRKLAKSAADHPRTEAPPAGRGKQPEALGREKKSDVRLGRVAPSPEPEARREEKQVPSEVARPERKRWILVIRVK